MNYTEIIQRASIAYMAENGEIYDGKQNAARAAANYAEALANELVRRGHLQGPDAAKEAEPLPESKPRMCASCVHYNAGNWCGLHNENTPPRCVCPDYE